MPTRPELMLRARRRRFLRVAATALVATLVLVAGGLVLTDTLRFPSGPEPVIAPTMADAEEEPTVGGAERRHR